MFIMVLSVLAGFLPLITDFGKIGTIENEESRLAISDAMNSKQWQFSIVASVALAVPVVIDLTMQCIYDRMSQINNQNQALFPRLVLIFSLFVPNILILTVGIPLQYKELVIAIFLTRIIFLFYGVLGHLWIMGETAFRSKWFVAAFASLSIGLIFGVYDTINYEQVTYLFWIAIAFYGIAISIFLYFAVKFFIFVKKIGLRNLDTPQISCLMYLILLCILGSYFYISVNIKKGNYDNDFFTAYTYVEAGFTLLFTAVHSFLTQREKLLIKDVSSYFHE